MEKQLKEIEIPFGAKDSELKGWEYTIPEGMEAEIKDGKIIVKEKESEDERMIQYFKDLAPFDKADELYEKYGFSHKDAIAWLEKQGGHAKFVNGIQVGDKVTRNEDGILVNLSQLNRVAKKDEKQGEHKHTDKVESKFHEGEWITNGDYTWKIVEVKPLDYILQSQDGNIVDDTISHVEEQFHSFTIEDARDGDVIYSRHNTESFEWIGIYKSLDKENKRVFFYGFWHDMAKTFSVCGNEAYVLYDDFSPATKEQRDTLMKAMADAGYIFDFEKKELKEIEPAEWSKEDEEYMRYLHTLVDNAASYEYSKKVKCFLKSLRPRARWKPSEEMLEALYKAIPENAMAMSEDEMLLDKLYQGLKYGRVLSKN